MTQTATIQTISTPELLERLQQGEHLEATKILIGGLRATHWIHMYEGVIYDEGIDSVEVERTPEEFIEIYRGAQWIAQPI